MVLIRRQKTNVVIHRKRERSFEIFFSLSMYTYTFCLPFKRDFFCFVCSPSPWLFAAAASCSYQHSYNGNSLRCKDLKSLTLLCFDAAWETVFTRIENPFVSSVFCCRAPLLTFVLGTHWDVCVCCAMSAVICAHRLSQSGKFYQKFVLLIFNYNSTRIHRLSKRIVMRCDFECRRLLSHATDRDLSWKFRLLWHGFCKNHQ